MVLPIVALSAALAAPTIELPEVFAEELERIRPGTDIPILLPQRMPDRFEDYVPTGHGRKRSWGLSLATVAGCGSATACFIGSFGARTGGTPFGPRRVRLARGRVGRYKPLTCGGSCSPPSIEWKERGATYEIQAKVGRPSRRILVRMADSAIRSGPR
jgi:hypothetical protein